LHRWSATANTPLCAYEEQGTWKLIKSTNITTALRLSVEINWKRYGLRKEDVSARSLRASGAMALLLGGVDSNTIKMLGRWRNDEMMRYLYISARQLVHKHASTMFTSTDYTLMAPDAQNG